MKRFYHVLGVLLSITTALTSCLGDGSSEVSLYDDAAITGFTLGTLTQYKPGTDSVVATLTGSNYYMSIDQLNGKIFNRTPLPVGTRVNSVLCTVSTLNNGSVALMNSADSMMSWFDSSQGVNFQEYNPRLFRVYASDGTFFRDYQVTLNVATSTGENFKWGNPVADTTLLKGFTDMRLVTLKEKRLLVLCGNGTNTLVRTSTNGGVKWTKAETEMVFADSAWASAVVKDSTLFLLSSGQLYSTKDGEQWTGITAPANLKQLVAAGTRELFALCKDSTLQSSADDGQNWNAQLTDETLKTDSVKRLLALKGIASLSFNYPSSRNCDYVLMVGNNGKRSVVWRKISHYDPIRSTDFWSSIPAEDINHYLLPAQQRLSLVGYNDAILAFGNTLTVYQTNDQGITWQAKSLYALPETMLTVSVDGEGNLCAISQSGKVYKGLKY